jgi:DNA-binding SARP family transcriptional activator/tetratricopeptide (TPR) repeat protein
VEVQLLGPVEAHTEGARLDLGPRKQRFVLAVLALEINRIVPVARLLELAWPEGAPRTAAHAIQVCVSGLRAALAGTSGLAIETRGGGYVLRGDPFQIDVCRFTDLLDRAAAFDGEGRVALLTEALELWHGPALADAAPPAVRERLSFGLEEARLTALEDRLEAQLRLGRIRWVITEAGALAEEHPTRERPLMVLMRALAAAGQAGEALDAYRRARAHLAEQYGLDPSESLRRLEVEILRGDPATHGPEPARPLPPRHLPPDPQAFAGRQRELADLDALLPARLVVISGTGGVGKTTLAVHWAHHVAGRYPDGQLYLNLRGYDPGGAVEPGEAVRGLLDELGVPAERVPETADGQLAVLRRQLGGKRVLLVLDNARDAEHVRPLLSIAAGGLTVVTSRSECTPLVATEGARPLVLDLLSTVEARELLGRRLGPDRAAGEPDAVDDIIARCARLPLALAIAAARASTHRAFPLAALAAELRDAAGGLDALDGGDPATDVRAVFSWSHRTLSEPAAHLFALLSLHPGPDVGVAAAASLAGATPAETRTWLTELTRANMLSEPVPGRYAFHDLLRAYAEEQVDERERGSAVLRVLEHYLHAAHAAAMILHGQQQPIALDPPSPGVTIVRAATSDEAVAWFAREEANLLAAVHLAAEHAIDPHTWQLAWSVSLQLIRRGRWAEQEEAQRLARAAARTAGDTLGEAQATSCLALGYARAGRGDEAEALMLDALALFERTSDWVSPAMCFSILGWLCERKGDYAGVLRYTQEALDRYRSAGHLTGQALALGDVGWAHSLLGHYEEAIANCELALVLTREHGYADGESATLHSLGYIYLQLGDYARSIDCFERSVVLVRGLADKFNEADTLSALADAYERAGDRAAAQHSRLRALALFEEIGHPDADALREKVATT